MTDRDGGAGLPILVLVLVTAAVFAPGFRNGFVNWDDPGAIVENAAIRDLSPGGIARLLTEPVFFAYVPLTFLSYAIDYRLYGLEPFGFHLTSLILHAAAAALLYLVARRWLSSSRWLAAGAALVFAVHPAQVETVTWMAGRKDPLAAAFLFGSILAFDRGLCATGARRRAPAFAGALALAVLANLAKASAIVFPLLFLAHEIATAKGEREPRRLGPLVLRHAPFFAAAGLLAALHLSIASSAGVAAPPSDLLPIERATRAGQAFLAYVAMTLVPVGLSPHYEIEPSLLLGILGLVLFLGVALFASLSLARGRAGAAALGAAVFLAGLLPFNTVFPSTSVVVADRYLCVALAGAGLAFAAAWRAAAASSRGAAAAAGAAALLGLALLTVRQEAFWRDSATLWARAEAIEPSSALVKLKRAEVATEEARRAATADARLAALRRAEDSFRSALAATSVPAHELLALDGLAFTLLSSARSEEAEKTYSFLLARLDRGAARGKPEGEIALFRANALRNRGRAREGRDDRAALADYEAAARLDPENADGRFNLGTLLGRLGLEGKEGGDLDRAAEELKAAAGLRAGFADAWVQLATIELGRRDLVQAVKALEAAIGADPSDADARLALARLWIGEGLVDEGEKAAASAAAAVPGDPRPYLLLGQIGLARGELDAAEIQFNKAATVAPDLAESRRGLSSVHLERSARARKSGDDDASLRHAAAAKAVFPEDSAPRLRLAELLAKVPARAEAAAEYDDLLWLFPDDEDVRIAAARFFKDVGYFHLLRREERTALASFARAAALRPDDPEFDAVRMILRNRKNDE